MGRRFFFWQNFLLSLKSHSEEILRSYWILQLPLPLAEQGGVFIIIIFFLAALCGLWDLYSLTRDGTPAQQWEHQVLTTGLPGNSQEEFLFPTAIQVSYFLFLVSFPFPSFFFPHSPLGKQGQSARPTIFFLYIKILYIFSPRTKITEIVSL